MSQQVALQSFATMSHACDTCFLRIKQASAASTILHRTFEAPKSWQCSKHHGLPSRLHLRAHSERSHVHSRMGIHPAIIRAVLYLDRVYVLELVGSNTRPQVRRLSSRRAHDIIVPMECHPTTTIDLKWQCCRILISSMAQSKDTIKQPGSSCCAPG